MSDFLEEWAFRGKASGEKTTERSARLPDHLRARGTVFKPTSAPMQRVVVKIASVKNASGGRAAAHMSYLLREGAGREGTDPVAFGKDAQSPPVTDEFLKTCEADRHTFRVILSPENGNKLDLESYGREVVARFERDLKTPLEWVGVAHYNTDQPHVHLVIRGVDDRGKDLFMKRDYIVNAARQTAEDVATRHLGFRTEHDVMESVKRSISAARFTSIDRGILAEAVASKGLYRLPSTPEETVGGRISALQFHQKREVIHARLAFLTELGVVKPVDPKPENALKRNHRDVPNAWHVPTDLAERIRFTVEDRAISERVMRAGRPYATQESEKEMLARVVSRGFKDDHNGGEYLVVDAVDGRSYYLDSVTSSLAKADSQKRVGAGDVLAVDATTVDEDGRVDAAKRKIVRLGVGNLRDSVTYDGPTWLDRQLVSPLPHADSQSLKGFGKDYQNALKSRTEVLEDRGIVGLSEPPPASLLKILRERERAGYEQTFATKHQKEVVKLQVGAAFEGEIHHRVALPGGNYTVVVADQKMTLLRSDKHLDSFSQGDKVRVSMSRNAEGRVRQIASPSRKTTRER